MCEAVNATPNDKNLVTLFDFVASQFLKLDFSKAEGGRKNSVRFYTLTLSPEQHLLEYRRMLLLQLYQIYKSGNCCLEIEHILSICRLFNPTVSTLFNPNSNAIPNEMVLFL